MFSFTYSGTYEEKHTEVATSPVSQARAVVLRGAPTQYKVGKMRRWIEDDKGRAQIWGTRWLVREGIEQGR